MIKVPIGIEIGERFLKIIASRPLKQPGMADCIVEPISSLSDVQIAKLIEETLHKAEIQPSSVTISMPRNSVTVRNLHLPSQDEKEIEQMLQLHIGRIVPYRKEEIIFDSIFLGADSMGYAKEIVAIVHIDTIRRQTKIVEAAGFFPEQIILSSYGAWQSVMARFKNQITPTDIYLLLDVDSAYVDFIVFNRESILFTRSINVESKDGMNSQEIPRIIGEIRQSVVMFGNEEGNKNLVKIFVCGSEAVTELYNTMKPDFDIPIECAPYICPEQVLKAKKREIPPYVSLSAVSQVMLGISGKKIAFTLPEIQARKSIKEKTKELTVLGTMIVYMLTALLVFFIGISQSNETYMKKISQQNIALEKDVGDLADKYKKTEFIKTFIKSRKAPLIFMSELQKNMPAEISITLIVIDDQNKVTLRGQSRQLSDTFKFINALEGTKYFKKVVTKYTRSKKVKDKEVTDFEINFDIDIGV